MKVFIFIFVLSLISKPPVSEAASAYYDSTPSVLPGNIVSIGAEANGLNEFGEFIQLSPNTSQVLIGCVVTLSIWAPASDWPCYDSGWFQNFTLNLYEVTYVNGTPTPSTLINSQLSLQFLPFKPEDSVNCSSGHWMDSEGNCWSGMAYEILIPLNHITVPNQFIYGVAFNTQHYGYQHVNKAGPYNSLNFGLSTSSPSIGSNVVSNSVIVNSSKMTTYSDNGLAGIDIFRIDYGWSPYTPAVKFL